VDRVHGIRSKVAYLQGLAEGLNIDESTREGRVLLSMIDVLDDMAMHVEEIVEAQNELADYVEEVDDDLSTLEDQAVVMVTEDEDEEDGFLVDANPT
jgi:DNA-directed RNA polymerase subunit delta